MYTIEEFGAMVRRKFGGDNYISDVILGELFLNKFPFTAVKSKNQKTTSIKRTAVAAKVLNKDNQHFIFCFSYFLNSLQQKIKIL